MILTGKSGVYAVIGDPIAQSLSPLMHNAAFQHTGIDAVYVPFHVSSSNLADAVNGMRNLRVRGFNITVPHKEDIIPLLDAVDPAALQIGAVNTVVNRDGVLTGFNTDATGFLLDLRSTLNFIPQGKRVLILGAGGAGRAACVALTRSGVNEITVANRTLSRAEGLVEEISGYYPTVQIAACGYDSQVYLDALEDVDLIVNTTSAGLSGSSLDFLPLENIKGSALIYDMLYSKSETALIKKAKALKIRCCDGTGMLAAQGEEAFKIWTGVELPEGFMKKCLI